MQAVCDFSSHRWIGGVDVPSAVLVTRQDQVVPPSRQMHLARALPGAEVVEVDGNHDVFLDAPGVFARPHRCLHLAAATLQSRPDGSEQAS